MIDNSYDPSINNIDILLFAFGNSTVVNRWFDVESTEKCKYLAIVLVKQKRPYTQNKLDFD